MSSRKKLNLVVTGAKGQLGSYLVDYFTKKSFLDNSRIGCVFGVDLEDLDIRCADDVAKFFSVKKNDPHVKIDYVIHCAAMTDTAAIEKDYSMSYAANCLGPKNIAEACAANGIKIVFISTDYVLSELSMSHSTKLQEFPVNQYGLQKLIAEQFVKEAYSSKPKDCMILRSSWMFGNSDRSFVEKFLANVFKAYAAGKDSGKVQVPVVDDAYGRPTPVWFIADTIECLVSNGLHGTMDLQYPFKQISRYEWAKMVWDAFISEPCTDSTLHKMVDELREKVEVVPKSSASIGVQMHHPGKVGNDFMLLDGTAVYAQDTAAYVHSSWLKHASMASSIINGTK